MVEGITVESVADADTDGVEAVENVELGQGDAVDAGGANRLAHEHGVEPAAAALAARDGAELAPALADALAGVVEEFGRERPLAHPRRVGFCDAEHVADRARP